LFESKTRIEDSNLVGCYAILIGR